MNFFSGIFSRNTSDNFQNLMNVSEVIMELRKENLKYGEGNKKAVMKILFLDQKKVIQKKKRGF